jgi:hypothetical protein
MRAWIACLALLSACGFKASGELPDGNGDMMDGGMDGSDAPIDAQPCFGPFLDVCLSALPTAAITISLVDNDLDINTELGGSASTLCDAGISNYCVVAATAITVAANKKIRGHGARPLVLVVLGTLDLFGEIDVSSSTDGTVRGAGASMAVCASTEPPTPATGASGGFGGSFGGRGGDGEAVSGNRGTAAPAVVGFPTSLQGGCPGGAGASGGGGGLGGGAVGIYAATVNLDGKINASGAGGSGGPRLKSGGGGGGSGGMIVLDVPQSAIVLGSSGRLFANGGGGGEGGAGADPGAGEGADGNPSTGPNVPGTGGSGGTDAGGNGGPGSSGTPRGGGTAIGQSQDDGGGGAGGGGAGFIHALGISGANIIAPPSVDTLPQ